MRHSSWAATTGNITEPGPTMSFDDTLLTMSTQPIIIPLEAIYTHELQTDTMAEKQAETPVAREKLEGMTDCGCMTRAVLWAIANEYEPHSSD